MSAIHPMDWSEIPAAVKAVREALPMLLTEDTLTVAATATLIMETAREIRMTANLKGLNELADKTGVAV